MAQLGKYYNNMTETVTNQKVETRDILNLINQEKDEFENKHIKIVPGYQFNQRNTIQQAYSYYNSQYTEGGKTDDEGDHKYFFNVVKGPVRTTTKAIDFDTKDIKFQTASGGNPLKTWYMERELKQWMKDKRFGKVLNRIFDELPKYGSSVLKVINGVPHFVDLRNFIVRQDADSLNDASYIIEKHLMTVNKFKKVGKKLNWDNIEKAVKDFNKNDEPYIIVWERYGNIDGIYSRIFFADVGFDTQTEQTGEPVPQDGIELKRTKIDKHPYWEFHMERIPGRWLGIGVIEILADTQIKMNTDTNLEAKLSWWMGTIQFQTSDVGFNRNLATESENGKVHTVEDPISQIPIDMRNTQFFSLSMQKWLLNRDEMTFARETIRGETPSSGTTLGAVRIATIQASGYFDQLMENIAESIKEFLYEVIIPQFKKENTQAHAIRLVGEDLDTYNKLFINQKTWNSMFEFMDKHKKLPSAQQFELMSVAIAEQIKTGQERLVELPKSFYDDAKYKIDIVITGEMKDTKAQANNMFAALQALQASGGMILKDPNMRKFFMKWLGMGGIPPMDFNFEEAPSIQQLTAGQQGGGGVSRPQAPAGIDAGRPETTV